MPLDRDALINLRTRFGWSQLELANRAGISQGHLSLIEAGKVVKPTAETVRKLAAALGVRPAAIEAEEAAA